MQYPAGKHPNSQKNLRRPWVRGQSGNPRGRPKGSATRRKLLKLVDEGVKEEARKILLQAVARGEPWAVELILEE